MEIFSSIINFFKDNWLEILALIGAIDIALGIIVKWTKWTWDDSVYAILHNLVSKLGKNKMKKYIFLFVFLVFLGGCAWLGQQVDYQKACMSDPACMEQAKKDAELGKTIAGMAYPAAGAPVGAAILALALWYRGRKKK